MNYRCLGNNEYEISLVVFRDCDAGIPWFDNPASIGVFDGLTNAYLFQQLIPLDNAINDTLDIYLPDSCLIVPSTACIHTTTYVDTITLAPNASGYTIAYQRCCRNHNIVNIVDPDDAGATYWIYISPDAMAGCNNSAVFNEWPRVYLCAGVPISFDHSATDLDGDSLVYELCTPFHGASDANPRPQPPNAPAYTNISWLPPYSISNMFGGTDPLAIDPVTGLLTGTPQNMGVFLVGICIKEYRNGVLISATHRDFQHIVGTCQPKTVADFSLTNLPCNDDLEFSFNNSSQVVTGTYNWFFDTLATSIELSPKYIFPDTGQYTVTLVAGIGSPCIDTFSLNIDAQLKAISVSMTLPGLSVCLGDTIQLYATDQYAGYSDTTNYQWGPSSNIISGQGTDTVIVFVDQPISFSVVGTNNYGCQDDVTVNVSTIENVADFNFNIDQCNASLDVLFNNSSFSNPNNNNYLWQFDTFGSSTATNSSFTFPDTGSYSVSLIAGAGSACPDTFNMEVDLQLTAVELSSIPDQTVCRNDSVWLSTNNIFDNYASFTAFNWSPSSAVSAGLGTDSILVIANNNLQFQLLATNNFGCSDSLVVNMNVVSVESAFDTLDLACNISLSIPFVNASTTNLATLDYLWTFDNLGTSSATDPIFTFPDTGFYSVSLVAGVGSLCPDTTLLDLYLPLYGVNLATIPTQDVCIGDSVWFSVDDLLAQYSSSIQYVWSPDSSILAGQGTDSILIIANANTSVQVAAVNSHLCQDSVLALVTVREVDAAFDTISLICNTSLVIPFVNNSTSNPVINSFQWTFDNLGTSALDNPSFTFPDTGTYTVSLIADAAGQCPDTISMNVYLPLHGLDIDANDVSVICKEDTVMLMVNNSLDAYTDFVNYQWFPANEIIAGQGNDTAYALMDTNTTFMVAGLNSHGCVDTAVSQGVIIYISPTLGISAVPDSIFVGQTAQLFATDDIDYLYSWEQDTSLSEYFIYDPEASPRTTTIYYLTVTNQFGCRTLDSVVVNIKEPICGLPVVFVPNAFSPDGDGHNDVLMVNGNNITEMSIAVYNRWGQKVFESMDQNMGWDGTFNGEALPPDVYGFYMQCTCDDGSSQFVKGNITLLR